VPLHSARTGAEGPQAARTNIAVSSPPCRLTPCRTLSCSKQAAARPRPGKTLEPQLKPCPRSPHVQLDSAWVKRLETLIELGRTAVIDPRHLARLRPGSGDVQHHTAANSDAKKTRFEVSKLIGATGRLHPAPVLPFWVSYRATLGGLAAACHRPTCAGSFSTGDSGTGTVCTARTSGSRFFGFADCLALACLPPRFLGWLGAYMSVSRHLAGIEPR